MRGGFRRRGERGWSGVGGWVVSSGWVVAREWMDSMREWGYSYATRAVVTPGFSGLAGGWLWFYLGYCKQRPASSLRVGHLAAYWRSSNQTTSCSTGGFCYCYAT